MNRLQSELHRLYLPRPTDEADKVRAMVMELAGPADWSELSKVWRGVQAELRWPAPAIAVSGSDGMQLWFSLESSVSQQRAADFLTHLRRHYLPDIAQARVKELSALPTIPKQCESTENWSAFIAPDLASVFVETPWLDVEPSVEGQADLLARLESISPADFDAAMQRLAPAAVSARSSLGASNLDPKRFLQQVLNDETVDLALRVEAAKALLRSS